MDALLVAKRQLDEKKNLLVEKNEELSDLNFRLEALKETLIELKNLNKSEHALDTIRQIEKEKLNILAEERKTNLLKEINIKNNNLLIYNCNYANGSYSKLDNLIKCLLCISNNSYSRFSLFNGRLNNIPENKDHEIIQNIKTSLFLSNDSQIAQNLIDEISNKIGESLSRNQHLPKCVLLENNSHKQVKTFLESNKEALFLYEYKDDYLVLRPDETECTVVDRAHEIMNNLLCEELLEDVCKIKYKEFSGKGINEADLNKLYQCLTEISNKLAANSDKVDGEFLDHLKLKSKIETINEKLIETQIKQLDELSQQVTEYSPEHESIKMGILLLKDTYIKRMGLMLFEECEQRKKKAKITIEAEIQDGNQIQIEIKNKQNEIDNLDKFISKREAELVKKNKEIEQKKEQLKLLEESRKKQDDELNDEIKKLREELKKKEDEFKQVQGASGAQKAKADQLRNEMKNINTKLNELKTNKDNLEKKRNELKDCIAEAIKERDNLEKEKVKFEVEKKAKENEIKELKTEVVGLTLWIKFIQNIYKELLINQELFKKRMEIREKLQNAQSLTEMYKAFVQINELKQFADSKLEEIAGENSAKVREIFENTFKNILAEPNIISYRDKSDNPVAELSGININYSEIEPILRAHIEQELKKSNYLKLIEILDTNNNVIDRVLTVNNDKLYFKEILNNQNICRELKDLIDRQLKCNFLIKNRNDLVNGKLSDRNEVAEYDEANLIKSFVKLGEMNAKSVLDNLKLSFNQLLKCYASTIKIIAGNNIYIDKDSIEMRGINIGMVAGQDIFLPTGFKIDTSGDNGFEFNTKFKQAYGKIETAEKLVEGESGVDGFDGLCGENGGHIYIKAEGSIVNLNQIDSLKYSGGKGATGQQGGIGQKGGAGADTGKIYLF